MRILIEGPDGAGKSTLCQALAEALEPGPGQPAEGRKVYAVAEPNHTLGFINPHAERRRQDMVDHYGNFDSPHVNVRQDYFVSLRDILLHPAHLPHHLTAVLAEEGWDHQMSRLSDLKDGDGLPPEVQTLLLMAGRAWNEHMVRVREENLRRSGFSRPLGIFDRWAPSTVVYQGIVGNEINRDHVRRVVRTYMDYCSMPFDLTVIISAHETAEHEVFNRTRDQDPDSIHDHGDDKAFDLFCLRNDFYRRFSSQIIALVEPEVAEEFLGRFGRVVEVSATAGVEKVYDEVVRAIIDVEKEDRSS